ncbi:hypothetical protein H6F77_08290 [Microcoleus sp. FACHB-831]|uniref:hypothetical protein n=1 Tax=Microcoleus sp. FACHB-831 TaxID=2692827 RepID=UPI0016865428|nr:hypothetical protein [Microcoleus sp. FACHB-831]MBD1921088.1 hypothetical protein [Microcoleus sp. FACHB-831]
MVSTKVLPKVLRPLLILSLVILFIGFLAFQIEIAFPATPSVYNTYTPLTKPAPSGIGSYDVLGKVVDKEEAANLLQTEEGRKQLSPESGAVAVTEELINLGRKSFYSETFKDQVFQTEVVGALNGPINLVTMTKAIARLGGKHTTNLQIPIDKDVTIGGKTFTAGTLLNTGMDVPSGSIIPLGMRTSIEKGKVRVGITCALCHATVDNNTGRVIEGAPNIDVDTGLLLAFATNSAALFRQTGVNPTTLPPGDRSYINANGETAHLPNAKTVEDAVDADLLSWPPGSFDSTGNMVNNPSQNPPSYTHETWPYGWSGNAAIGWFHGLTTLNSNVHGTNSDATTGADSSEPLLGIDKETYLGVILQNSANKSFRLPQGARPSKFFDKIDPTPGYPGMNEVIPMPGFPKGSPFILDGLMASSPGFDVGEQLNGMSAWQNTLAPPPVQTASSETLKRGAAIFTRASCVECHSGRYFTNHEVIPANKIGTQRSRGPAQSPFPRIFTSPETYPSNVAVPLPPNPPTLPVPTDLVPQQSLELAFAINNPAGGYKVPTLLGLAVTAPYLHDGGVAASASALKPGKKGFFVGDRTQMGMAGTLMKNIQPDPSASLRVLLDRNLRKAAIAANRANPDLQQSNVDGSGHNYWVDKKAGFTTQEQTDLIQYLLSLDDDPEVLPNVALKD